MIAALPMRGKGAKDLVEFRIRGGRFGEGKGFAAGELENFAIAEWIGDVKAEVAGLACAEKFAGAAKKKVGFGDFEAVGSADHGFKACFGVFVHVARSYEYAMTMTLALGTSTPTSTTVVATRICISLSRNLIMTISFSSLERRPCSKPSFNFGKTCLESFSYSSMAAFSSSFDSSMTG